MSKRRRSYVPRDFIPMKQFGFIIEIKEDIYEPKFTVREGDTVSVIDEETLAKAMELLGLT